MIDAKELRKGNYVLLDIKCILPLPHKIQAKDIYDISINNNTEWNIEPIPLTGDILLKCGFELRSNGMYAPVLKGYRMRLFNNEINYYYAVSNWMTIELKSLHQLQNLYFALTGEELNVKL